MEDVEDMHCCLRQQFYVSLFCGVFNQGQRVRYIEHYLTPENFPTPVITAWFYRETRVQV